MKLDSIEDMTNLVSAIFQRSNASAKQSIFQPIVSNILLTIVDSETIF